MVGHGDWESRNLRWTDDQPKAVHDWDSVTVRPEVAIVDDGGPQLYRLGGGIAERLALAALGDAENRLILPAG